MFNAAQRAAEQHAERVAIGARVAEMMQARDDRDWELEAKLQEALMDEFLASEYNGRIQPGAWMDGAFFAWEETQP